KGVYTETRGNVPPMVSVPTADDEKNVRRLTDEIAAADKAVKDEESRLGDRQRQWEQTEQTRALPAEPADWNARAELDECLHFMGPHGTLRKLAYRAGAPKWVDAPTGKALRLDGKDNSLAELERFAGPDRTDHFSYGAWVFARGTGAVVSK